MDMDEAMIKRESGQYDLELVQRLYLENQFIKKISNTTSLINLIDLSLSRNEIVNITSLSSLTSLRRLDLSYNKIQLVKGLDGLENLQWLDIAYNKIESLIDTMEHLRELPKLNSLKLGASINDKYDQISTHGGAIPPNPCVTSKKYPLLAFEYLPRITVLDGSLVSILKEAAFDAALEGRNDAGKDETLTASEVIDAASWFVDDATHEENHANIHNNNTAMDAMSATQVNVQKMLTEEGSHLLRKADKLLNEKL